MIVSVIEMILPIAIAFSIGVLMRRKNMMDDSGSAAIKTIVSKFMLPVILLNAFMFADYSKDAMAIIIVFLDEKPRRLEASCCMAEVVKGGGAAFLRGRTDTDSTV